MRILPTIASCVLALLIASPSFAQVPPVIKQKAKPKPVFRVTLVGYQADEQTNDTMFQTDGKGDEIYTLVNVASYESSAPTMQRYRSILMGDGNDQPAVPERMAVGNLSDQGGIGTGFRMLPRNPPRGAYNALTLPMVVYRGSGPVIVVPTIWEWDGDDKFARTYMQELETTFLRGPLTVSFVRDAEGGRLDPAAGVGPLFSAARVNWMLRTFGYGRDGSDFVIGEATIGDERVFRPQFLLLTSEMAVAAARRSGSLPALRATNGAEGTLVEPLFPAGFLNGVINVRYEAAYGKKGSYTMFLKVEMMN